MYLRNSWYVAGWDYEFKKNLTTRTILEENLVFFREENGKVVALENACTHRKLPLSYGKLIKDHIQCGYHGLEFDCSGACQRIPGQDKIPPQIKVKSYPTVEKWNWIWVWMGDEEKADESLIMDVPHFNDKDWSINRGPSMTIDCHYQVYTDNLLDPSHVSFVHPTTLAGKNQSGEEVPIEVNSDDITITASRWTLDGEPAPIFELFHKYSNKVDRLQSYQLHLPSLSVIRMICADTGTGAQDGQGKHRLELNSYNFITPETADSCRYYWFQMRDFLPVDEVSSKLTASFLAAFNEDKIILEAVHQGLKYEKTPHINLAIDKASVRARRILQQLIDLEQVES
jgi:phenylpropionate dioxygenase-like ring-hydroxylating dioxygenase large terminal subunit